MPIIPRGTENTRMNVSSPVPISGTTEARISGESIASAGKAFSEFGRQQLEFDRSLKRSEAENALRNAKKESEDYARQTAKVDGSDYGDKFKERFNELSPDIMSQHAGNDPKLQKYVGAMTQIVADAGLTDASLEGAARMEKNNWNRKITVDEDRAKRIEANPTGEMIASELVGLHASDSELLSSGAMSADNVYKSTEAAKNLMAKGYIAGLVRNKRNGEALNALNATQENINNVSEFDPQMAKEMGLVTGPEADSLVQKGEKFKMPLYTKGDKVKLTPEVTAVMQSLTPAERSHFIDKITAAQQAEVQAKMSDMHAGVEGFKDVALSGTVDSKFLEQEAAKLKQSLNSFPNMTLQAKARTHAQIDAYQVIGNQLNLARTMPAGVRDKLLEGVVPKIDMALQESSKYDARLGTMKNDIGVLGIKIEAKERLEKSLPLLKTEEERDGVGAAMKAFPELEAKLAASADKDTNPDGKKAYDDYLNSVIAAQRFLGVNNVRVTSIPEASQMAYILGGLKDPAQATNQLGILEAQYGQHFPKVMEEVGKANKDLADLKLVAYSPPEGRQKLVDAILNKPGVEGLYKDSFKENTVAMDLQISKSMAPFQSVLFSAANDVSSAKWVKSLNDQIEMATKRDLVKNPTKSIDSIVKDVYSEVVDSNYYIASGGKSKVIVPRQIDGKLIPEYQLNVFSAYIGKMATYEKFKELGIAVPTAYKNMTDKEINFYKSSRTDATEDFGTGIRSRSSATEKIHTGEDVYYSQLEDSHRWVPNSDLTGIRLKKVDARTGVLSDVPDKTGTPIEKSYKDIYYNPGKDIYAASQSIIGRMFGF